MTPRLIVLAPLAALALASQAWGQQRSGEGLFNRSFAQPASTAAAEGRNLPRLSVTRDRYDEDGFPVVRNGLVASVEVEDGVTIGLGRFSVTEIARPRSNVESLGRAADIRQRDRNIAAVGLQLRF
ncbi:MAG: hypothetical protein ACK4K7_00160 [Allosphingosinicella sp.]|uniref:hypothetical protein n=1 Tax=Allosphingosinicella sp. TaxID=2823234 RepID=UPI00395BDFB0